MKTAVKTIIDKVNEYLCEDFTPELKQAIKIEVDPRRGDLSLAAISLEREIDEDYPHRSLAGDLLSGIGSFGSDFTDVRVVNGFLNFSLDKEKLISRTLTEVLSLGDQYGRNNQGEGKKVVVDYSAPNVGKPLHVGHIRSTILGDSLIRMMDFSGFETHGINYIGDVGLHIGKILHAYKEKGSLERLEANPEGELLDLYVSFCKEEKEDSSLADKAKAQVQLVEEKDPETLEILSTITKYSLLSFDRVYELLNTHIDETRGQSHFSDAGKKIVERALETGLAEKTKDGAVVMKLQEYGLPDKIVLRSDGTAIYSTQDLGAAVQRYEDHQFDRMLYVVGEAQALYFRQLFKSLELLGHEWSGKCEHVGFGLINLEEGKMATREGNVVYLEELLQKAIARSKEVIEVKNPDLKDKDEVARVVGIGAVKYQVLSIDNVKDINFSWNRSLNFEGKSSPNIQYTYARARSVMEKVGYSKDHIDQLNFSPEQLSGPEEYALIKKMALFPKVVESACDSLRPNVLATYGYELAATFNKMYGSTRILEDDNKIESRMALLGSYRQVIKNCMGLLGIGMVEEM